MAHVALYPGAMETLRGFAAAGHKLFVVSHKTRRPFAGPPHDLHEWAWSFLRARGLIGAPDAPFDAGNVYFELTKEEKIARAATLGCEMFIDDLPEILAMPGFPAGTRRILFDPEGNYPGGRWRDRVFEHCASWGAIARLVA